MEIIKYETCVDTDRVELRCRDSCPCGFREFVGDYLPSPDQLV